MNLDLLMEPGTALPALLLAGHFVGDALLPARRPPSGGRSFPMLAGQALLLLAVHSFLALPFLGTAVALSLLALAVVHLPLRAARAASDSGLGRLLLVRAVHAAVVIAAGLIVAAVGSPAQALLPAAWLPTWVTVSVVLAAFAFNAAGGSEVVAAVLGPLADSAPGGSSAGPDASGRAGVGRLIGILERTLTLILILSGQWAAMALLATAKSVARFDDLKNREFAEYYLVGTLTSLLVAIVIGLALRGMGL